MKSVRPGVESLLAAAHARAAVPGHPRPQGRRRVHGGVARRGGLGRLRAFLDASARVVATRGGDGELAGYVQRSGALSHVVVSGQGTSFRRTTDAPAQENDRGMGARSGAVRRGATVCGAPLEAYPVDRVCRRSPAYQLGFWIDPIRCVQRATEIIVFIMRRRAHRHILRSKSQSTCGF
ncbi:hypothetical protein HU200_066535 [Digitaria exilis]|uniref:Uncharacterized protein n=1 Tax=Digitaria exilis TaxID=1010633 RepID=A0A835A6G0_9POAL|nr:hypothetical protein HU200_066535 [Digitaria exilis]